ncbi:titin homolog isoform X1 [Trichogramma pretiosum]|uniref:titin homolog isoform X1 n=1 Tax=Trichogramma pretiosum TaxID=7493 RepID=UPI0006C9A40C|nr:titin homolog isoform X1 [Trichogramma pretiosum]XP_014235271.1 titin homolog isoform X1 [Trichogramma pretiosum]XP_014235272.1 titin homolog isoform X1 [Trichogramma pretiosum]
MDVGEESKGLVTVVAGESDPLNNSQATVATIQLDPSSDMDLLSNCQSGMEGTVIIFDNDSQQGIVKLVNSADVQNSLGTVPDSDDLDNFITLHAATTDQNIAVSVDETIALPAEQHYTIAAEQQISLLEKGENFILPNEQQTVSLSSSQENIGISVDQQSIALSNQQDNVLISVSQPDITINPKQESITLTSQQQNITQEQQNVDLASEQHNISVISEQHNLPTTSEQHNFPETLEQSNITIAPEQHNITITTGEQRITIPIEQHSVIEHSEVSEQNITISTQNSVTKFDEPNLSQTNEQNIETFADKIIEETTEFLSFKPDQKEIKQEDATPAAESDDDETIATFTTSTGQQLALYAVEDSDEVFAVALYDESGEPPTNFHFLMKADVERLIGEGAVKTVKKPNAQQRKEAKEKLAKEKKEKEEIKFDKYQAVITNIEKPDEIQYLKKVEEIKKEVGEGALQFIAQPRPVAPKIEPLKPVISKQPISKILEGANNKSVLPSIQRRNIVKQLTPKQQVTPRTQATATLTSQIVLKSQSSPKLQANAKLHSNSKLQFTPKSLPSPNSVTMPKLQGTTFVPSKVNPQMASKIQTNIKKPVTPKLQAKSNPQIIPKAQVMNRQVTSKSDSSNQSIPMKQISKQTFVGKQQPQQFIVARQTGVKQTVPVKPGNFIRQYPPGKTPIVKRIFPANQTTIIRQNPSNRSPAYIRQIATGRPTTLIKQVPPPKQGTTQIIRQISPGKKMITKPILNQEGRIVNVVTQHLVERKKEHQVTYLLPNKNSPYIQENPIEDNEDSELELMEQSTMQYVLCDGDTSEGELTFDELQASLQSIKKEKLKTIPKKIKKIRPSWWVNKSIKRQENITKISPVVKCSPKLPPIITQRKVSVTAPMVYRTYRSSPKKLRTPNNLLQAHRKIKKEDEDPSYIEGNLNSSEDIQKNDDTPVLVTPVRPRSRKQQLTVVNRADSEIIIQPASAYSEDDEEITQPRKRGRRKKQTTNDPDYNPRASASKAKKRTNQSVELIEIDAEEADENSKKSSSDKENDDLESDSEVEPKQKQKPKQVFMQCSDCNRNFRKKKVLERHMQICTKNPTNIQKMEEKKALEDSKEKKFTCKACGEKFSVAVSLARHVRATHSPKKRGRPRRTDHREDDTTDMEESSDDEKANIHDKDLKKKGKLSPKKITPTREDSGTPEIELKLDSSSENVKEPPKRRGRPPKAIKKEISETPDSKSKPSALLSEPRRRGRPPKQRTISKDEHSESSEPEEKNKIERPIAQVPKKRGRWSDRISTSTPEPVEESKKRGRPPTKKKENQLTEDDENENKSDEDDDKSVPISAGPLKKRVRLLAKSVSESEEKLPESTTDEPKKRGRPTKKKDESHTEDDEDEIENENLKDEKEDKKSTADKEGRTSTGEKIIAPPKKRGRPSMKDKLLSDSVYNKTEEIKIGTDKNIKDEKQTSEKLPLEPCQIDIKEKEKELLEESKKRGRTAEEKCKDETSFIEEHSQSSEITKKKSTTDNDQKEDSPDLDEMIEELVEVLEKTPRKRGRFTRKNKEDESELEDNSEDVGELKKRGKLVKDKTDIVDSNEKVDDQTASPPKKRGRPAKSSKEQSMMEVEEQMEEMFACLEQSNPHVIKNKDNTESLSDPKKNKKSDVIESLDVSESGEKFSTTIETLPKKRGRPPTKVDKDDALIHEDKTEGGPQSKSDKTDESENSSKELQTRSRASKIESNSESEMKLESASTSKGDARKRGRPSKSEKSSKDIVSDEEFIANEDSTTAGEMNTTKNVSEEDKSTVTSNTPKLKKFSCENCHEFFTSVAALNAHRLTHRTKKSGMLVYHCSTCKKLVPAEAFSKHLASHGRKGPASRILRSNQ